MIQEFNDLKNKFLHIKNQGWIKSIRKGSTGNGVTFEYLLGLQENNLEIPDYEGIEIKTKRNYSNSYTTLFNCTPEGPHFREIERLVNKYGYPDLVLKECKVINNSIFTNSMTKINSNYYFKLTIDRNSKKVFLNVIDIYGNLIENNVYWTFETLEEKLYRKLKNLAFIDATRKVIDKEEYFRYYRLTMYQLKNFNCFINLLEQGIIRITFKIGVFRTGSRKGQIHDHGTGFDIKENDLLKLYNLYET